MTLCAITLIQGQSAWVNPESVEYVRPLLPSETFATANAIVGFASGQFLAVRNTVDDLVRDLRGA